MFYGYAIHLDDLNRLRKILKKYGGINKLTKITESNALEEFKQTLRHKLPDGKWRKDADNLTPKKFKEYINKIREQCEKELQSIKETLGA
jgi:ribosomal protein L14E/L6E/L27E